MCEETEKPLSRSAEWQLANVFMGLCRQCGKDPIPGKKVCEQCREKQAERARNRYRLKHGIPLDAPPWFVRKSKAK